MSAKNDDGKFDDADEEEDIINAFLKCQVIDKEPEKPSCSTDVIVKKNKDRTEYFKAYKLANQEKIKKEKAIYYEDTKVKRQEQYKLDAKKISEYRANTKFKCDCCNKEILINSKSAHLKTDKHKANLKKAEDKKK
jgi:hypothetical protein